jgi:hypothetical protein
MLHRLSAAQWKSIKPALLIGLALAALQIGSGVAAYYQSKSLLWDGKYQTAQNLSRGLVVAVADQMVVKDYASVESRILQTMSNVEVASVMLTDTSGRRSDAPLGKSQSCCLSPTGFLPPPATKPCCNHVMTLTSQRGQKSALVQT